MQARSKEVNHKPVTKQQAGVAANGAIEESMAVDADAIRVIEVNVTFVVVLVMEVVMLVVVVDDSGMVVDGSVENSVVLNTPLDMTGCKEDELKTNIEDKLLGESIENEELKNVLIGFRVESKQKGNEIFLEKFLKKEQLSNE